MTDHYDQREALHSIGKMGGPGKPPITPLDPIAVQLAKEAQDRQTPVMVACSRCGHSWACCYLPMPLEEAARLMISAKCPKGCLAPANLANLPGV